MAKTITLQNLTPSEITRVEFFADSARADVGYVLKDAGGNTIKIGGLAVALSPGNVATLNGIINAVLIPAIEAAEGI